MVVNFFNFENIDYSAFPKKKWMLNISVVFCALITIAITLWFYKLNVNIAHSGFTQATPMEWIGITAFMYGISLIPFSIVLLVEKFAFKTPIIPLLGLRHTKNAVKNNQIFITLLLIASFILFVMRLFLSQNRQISIIFFIMQIPVNIIEVPCEEIIFRGYVQSIMIRRFGDLAGIIITAVLFFIVHLPVRLLLQNDSVIQSVYQLVFTLVGAVVFGIIARKDRCIYGAAVVHFTVNMCNYMSLM
jgi:membrane protease YdiL (CAAX protease family)